MIDEQMLWKIVCENAESIKTINGELGGVVSSLQWVKSIVTYQFWLAGGIFIAVISNFILSLRNGRRK